MDVWSIMFVLVFLIYVLLKGQAKYSKYTLFYVKQNIYKEGEF